MKSYEILSSVSLASIFLFCVIGCDAGKPRNSTPIADHPQAGIEETAKPAIEQERELVAIGENVSGKADFAEGGDRHIMAPILVPLGQYFTVQDRIANLRRQDAMNKYKAMNDNKPPATHEEYMKEIIEANNITLSPLRNPNDKYQYDPASGELMISTVRSQ